MQTFFKKHHPSLHGADEWVQNLGKHLESKKVLGTIVALILIDLGCTVVVSFIKLDVLKEEYQLHADRVEQRLWYVGLSSC